MSDLKLVWSNPAVERTAPRGKLSIVARDGVIVDETITNKAKAQTQEYQPKTVDLKSSWIKRISLRRSTLTITTSAGKKYQYWNVDLQTFKEFAKADSPGHFYLHNIADRYPRKKTA